MTAPEAPAAPPRGDRDRGRIVGVDAARCLALLGMMATHIVPPIADGDVTALQQVSGGRSSATFAVLAGVSLVLVAGTRRPVRGRPWAGLVAGTVVRALLVGLLGLWLGGFTTGIAVILAYYAVFFVLAVPWSALTARQLAVAAGVWSLLGPAVSYALRARLDPPSYDVPELGSLADPGALLVDLLLTGYYPAATWVPYLLLGMALARLDLRSPRLALGLVAGGAAAALAGTVLSEALLTSAIRSRLVAGFTGPGWRGDLATTLTEGLYGTVPTTDPAWLLVHAPHSGTTFDLVVTAGSAVAVLGACLLLSGVAAPVVRVAFGAGAMTLTLYTLHVLSRQPGWWDARTLGTWLGQAATALAIGAAYALARRRGPLERLVAAPSVAVRRRVDRGVRGNRRDPG